MAVLNKPKYRIKTLCDRYVKGERPMRSGDRGTALAFSGDLKHWMSKQKNKPLF
jgi:hypothetical protein